MLLVSGLLNLTLFTPSALAQENYPTMWVKIHRIQRVDTIETGTEGGADWRYTVVVSDGETLKTQEFMCPSNNDDITLDLVYSFSDLKAQEVSVTISLYELDASDSETADISDSGTAFNCIYNLAVDDFSGDEAVVDGEYYKTSGDSDGSTQTDENDANLWFSFFDNYDAPVAEAGDDQSFYTGELVDFDGSLSAASEGSSIETFEWDFENDGVVDAEGETTSYIYIQKGMQTCRLIVTDSIGVTSEDVCMVNILNRNPVAEFTFSPNYPSIQDELYVTDLSTDADGLITAWLWDFGDGTNSSFQSPSHVFSQKGEYNVTLTVTDDDGAENSTVSTVVVVNLPPTASFDCAVTPYAGVDFQFTDNSTDPENLSLSWLWDFGDGSTSELQNPVHKFANEDDYNVTLTVTDDEGLSDTFSATLTVTERPPTDVAGEIPIWAIMLVVVIAVVGVLGVFWWSRRKISGAFDWE